MDYQPWSAELSIWPNKGFCMFMKMFYGGLMEWVNWFYGLMYEMGGWVYWMDVWDGCNGLMYGMGVMGGWVYM